MTANRANVEVVGASGRVVAWAGTELIVGFAARSAATVIADQEHGKQRIPVVVLRPEGERFSLYYGVTSYQPVEISKDHPFRWGLTLVAYDESGRVIGTPAPAL